MFLCCFWNILYALSSLQNVKKIKDKAEKDVVKRLEKSDKMQKKMDKQRESEQKLLDKERELLEKVDKGEGKYTFEIILGIN